MGRPYRPARELTPSLDGLVEDGCEVSVGRGRGGGGLPGGDLPHVWYWCAIECPDGRRGSGSGDTEDEAFEDALSNLKATP